MAAKTFRARIADDGGGKAYVVLPFDPDAIWGPRPRHLLRGVFNGRKFRGSFDKAGGEWRCSLGPVLRRDLNVDVGDDVALILEPEGPQRQELDPDIAAALAAEPEAAAFFDGLAQFYRKAYLTWVTATKRKPDERARRIAEFVTLLKAGKKARD